jgi:hypothetical protein
MPFVLTADQKTRVAVSLQDRYGNAATIDGDPRWETSDPGVVTVSTLDAGMAGDIVAVGRPGTAQVTVRCDADVGDGVRELVGVLDVEVVGGEAVLIALNPAAAEPKGPAEPARAAAPTEPPPPEPAPAQPPAPEPPSGLPAVGQAEPAPATPASGLPLVGQAEPTAP